MQGKVERTVNDERERIMKVRSYRELKVWQHGMKLAEEIYHLTEKFPKYETYALSNQIERAVVSIPSNIAEGHARESTKEFLHHISIAGFFGRTGNSAHARRALEVLGRHGIGSESFENGRTWQNAARNAKVAARKIGA
jgi:hypothetical protein